MPSPDGTGFGKRVDEATYTYRFSTTKSEGPIYTLSLFTSPGTGDSIRRLFLILEESHGLEGIGKQDFGRR